MSTVAIAFVDDIVNTVQIVENATVRYCFAILSCMLVFSINHKDDPLVIGTGPFVPIMYNYF